MYKFYAFLNRMKYIRRWSLMHSIREENIMEHSQQVAVLAHALAVIANKNFGTEFDIARVVLLAQYHEVSEVITGDLPTPIKYFNREMKTAYKALERNAAQRLLDMLPENIRADYTEYVLPDDATEEYRLVKAADRLAAYLKCVEEMRAGNNEFKKAMLSIEEDLRNLRRPEVDYFLREFAPAFDLTLDELD
ncbi:MAG: 5'-deoxynucleotidase [Clostridia bacterium]|nr:5'-deoxynucleotidase [Clostridia bacterium]